MCTISLSQAQSLFKTDEPICTNWYKIQTRSSVRLCVAKGGQPSYTHQALDEIPVSDTFAWNGLMQTHLTNRQPHAAVSVYHEMLLRGVFPDRHTLPRVLIACRLSPDLCAARQVHAHALKLGFSFDQYVISALIDVYGRLDSVDTAKWLFDKIQTRNAVCWTMLAKLYLMENKPLSAINMFTQMVESKNTHVDPVGLATAIAACAMLKSLKHGRKVHKIAKKCGLQYDVLVSNSLSKMYIDCDCLDEARSLFNDMPCKDIISWTEMIRGYVRKGRFNEGLKLLRQMVIEGIKPDSLAISTVLPACARMAAHKNGKEIHGYLIRNGIDLNLTVQNAVMDMYVKSGSIESASQIFARIKKKDLVSWTVMLLGYSLHGQGDQVVGLLHEMQKDVSLEIDQFTHVVVLRACSSFHMVEEGKLYFSRMKKPEDIHYALMVGLLARAGLFDEARTFMEKHQLKRHTEALRALLDGCRIHKRRQIAHWVIERLCDLEPLNADNYVLLSNWYAESGKFDMVDRAKQTIQDMGLKPKKAYSWIEYRNKVHVFGTGDVSHPRSKGIYWELECLRKKMEENGYVPVSDFGLHDVDEERECIQIGHSEMLAISFGLISTQQGATVRVTKNLRMCGSCHDSAELISKITGREIILKDPNGFHHFKDGACSCAEFR